MQIQGRPLWYELSTDPAAMDAATAFYRAVLDWQFRDAGFEGFDYRLAVAADDLVAGFAGSSDAPPAWTIYFGADSADETAAAITAAGGRIIVSPADIPDTGSYAIASDPQGAVFGILEPLPMEDGTGGNAFDQGQAGHGNWNELMSTDPEGGLTFYSGLFGWRKSTGIDMGDMGTYQLFAHDGADIGGMMGLGNSPVPCWLAYFGVNGIDDAAVRVTDNGGTVIHGPQEVPGSAWIVICRDPQGAHFALVGPKAHQTS